MHAASPGHPPRLARQAEDRLPPPLQRLLKTAQQEIDRHINDCGLCAVCGSAFPCHRATLADLALSAM